MRRKPAVDTALYIPDSFTDIYAEDAARQVAASWPTDRSVAPAHPGEPERPAAAPAAAGAGTSERLLLVAVVIGFVGWTLCTVWWTWLAIDTGTTMWRAFAGVGIGSLTIATFVALRHLLVGSRAARVRAVRPG